MGEGLASSAGGSNRLPCGRPKGAGSIVELLALGVAISKVDWKERVGEARGERSSSSAAMFIALPEGGRRTRASATEERLRVGRAGRESQSL